ncbi:MAG: hypothetical protein FJ362_00690 [Gemmatimonadetes bacterium]|nr:hypothetical protein [Gemmatimonadota bacterium]MBM4190878.1 hypothetical protein [Gemmatimonadota bacterium]
MYKSVDEMLHDGWGGAIVCVGAGVIIFTFVRLLGGVRVGAIPMAVGLFAAGAMGRVIQRAVVQGAGKAAEAVVNPSGKTTPYVPTFSHIETLVIRGDLAGAEQERLEEEMRAPEHPQVVMRIAEFYLRTKGDRVTALSYYERLVALPTVGAELTGYARRKIEELRSVADRG